MAQYAVVKHSTYWGMPADFVCVGDTWVNIADLSADGPQPKGWFSKRAAQEFADKQKLDAHETVEVWPMHTLKAKSSYYE